MRYRIGKLIYFHKGRRHENHSLDEPLLATSGSERSARRVKKGGNIRAAINRPRPLEEEVKKMKISGSGLTKIKKKRKYLHL